MTNVNAEARRFEGDLPSKAEIFEFWKEKSPEQGIFIDWGEPSCWACGFHYGTKYDIKRSDASWKEIYSCWDAVPLQRCHIVPRCLGGNKHPSNFYLMCRECHDSAPNTAIPEIFFEWARNQSWLKREEARMMAAFRAFRIDKTDWQRYSDVIRSKEFRRWFKAHVGIHRPQSGYAAISHRMTYATIIGLAKYFVDNGSDA
jgi:hypothetical protein